MIISIIILLFLKAKLSIFAWGLIFTSFYKHKITKLIYISKSKSWEINLILRKKQGIFGELGGAHELASYAHSVRFHYNRLRSAMSITRAQIYEHHEYVSALPKVTGMHFTRSSYMRRYWFFEHQSLTKYRLVFILIEQKPII